MDHITDRDLKGWLEGRLTPRARNRTVRHLLSRCEECPDRLRALIPPNKLWTSSAPETEDVYDTCIDRAMETARLAAEALKNEQERRENGLKLVRTKGWGNLTSSERRSFRGRRAEVEMLLELSFELRYRDRRGMLKLALSAERAADRLLATATYSERLVWDLRALTSAEVANAERVNERYRRAEKALRKSRSLLEQGTDDLMVRARLDEVEASLRNAQGLLTEAEDLLDQAYRNYLKLGERHLAGRSVMVKGICKALAEKPIEAVPLFRQALSLLDASRDPQLVAAAEHDLLNALVDSGQIREAREFLMKSGIRKKLENDPLNLRRIRWVDGKIFAARGRYADAEQVFTEVRDGFRTEGLEIVAAVAGLDVAKIVLRQGRLDQAYEVARELLARAERCRLPPAAQSALHTFEIMCEMRLAETKNAERVQRFLRDLERRPSLQWEPDLILYG